jgi:hypothetical protein
MEWKRKKAYDSNWIAQPPYIVQKPETRTCLGPEMDMSRENCLGISGNFGNCPKN